MRPTRRAPSQTWKPFEELCPELAETVKAWEARMRQEEKKEALAFAYAAARRIKPVDAADWFGCRSMPDDPNGLDDWSWMPPPGNLIVPGWDDGDDTG